MSNTISLNEKYYQYSSYVMIYIEWIINDYIKQISKTRRVDTVLFNFMRLICHLIYLEVYDHRGGSILKTNGGENEDRGHHE